MIDGKLALDAIRQLQLGQPHDAGIENEHVDRVAHVGDPLGGRHNTRQVGQLDDERRRIARDAVTRVCGFLPSPGRANDMCAAQRQDTHRFETEPGIAAGDQRRLTGEVQSGRYVFGGTPLGKFRLRGNRASGDGRCVAPQVRVRRPGNQR